MRQVVFNGTAEQAAQLLEAIQHNCECKTTNGKQMTCASHEMLFNQTLVDRLLFQRWLQSRWHTQEDRPYGEGECTAE